MTFESTVWTFDLPISSQAVKTNLIASIVSSGGHLSYDLSSRTTHLVADEEHSGNSELVRQAYAEGIEVVNADYVTDCAQQQTLLSTRDYWTPKTDSYAESVAKAYTSSTQQHGNENWSQNGSSAPKVEYDYDYDEEDSESEIEEVDEDAISGDGDERFGPPGSNEPPPRGRNIKVKTYKAAAAPPFPESYRVLRHFVLQMTDLTNNNNKYYVLEQHKGIETDGRRVHRVYTHYGRTDELATKDNAGVREVRHYDSAADAADALCYIYHSKVAKGYAPVSLASGKIGSEGLQRAANRAAAAAAAESAAAATKTSLVRTSLAYKSATTATSSSLDPRVQDLVEYLYSEATSQLTTTVAVEITDRGLETPLGVLSRDQVAAGISVLDELRAELMAAESRGGRVDSVRVSALSGRFYSLIPHKLTQSRGGSNARAAMAAATIDSLDAVTAKEELCQLMMDMLLVNADGAAAAGSALVNKYRALRCHIHPLDPTTQAYRNLKQSILASQVRESAVEVVNIYEVSREGEEEDYNTNPSERRRKHKLLYHGSRISNWVGLLSRGILLPKSVVAGGAKRTDAGMLGAGIYFGDSASTPAQYSTPGAKGTRLMVLNDVALGEVKDYTERDSSLTAAPPGYDSTHGVRSTPFRPTDFADDEYVVYERRQQRMRYLVEFTAVTDSGSFLDSADVSSTGFVSHSQRGAGGAGGVGVGVGGGGVAGMQPARPAVDVVGGGSGGGGGGSSGGRRPSAALSHLTAPPMTPTGSDGLSPGGMPSSSSSSAFPSTTFSRPPTSSSTSYAVPPPAANNYGPAAATSSKATGYYGGGVGVGVGAVAGMGGGVGAGVGAGVGGGYVSASSMGVSSLAAPGAEPVAQVGPVVFIDKVTPGRSTVSRLLVLASVLFKQNAITAAEKAFLKDATLSGDTRVIAILGAFETTASIPDAVDSIKRLAAYS